MYAILITALLSPTSAHAAKKNIYRQTPPAQVCIAASDLDAKTDSCDDNQIFLQAAQACWSKVKKIDAQVTKELQAQVALNQAGAQNQDFASTKANEDEAVAAHTYMLQVTQTALDEVDKYFDTVVLPEDLGQLSDDEVVATACYHDAVVPMDQITEQMEDKIDEIESSKGMEGSMGKTAGSRQSNTNSLSGSQVQGGQGQSAPANAGKQGTSNNGASSITGVQQDKDKQSQQK